MTRERTRADVLARQGLVFALGLVAVVIGLLMHTSLLTGLGVALVVISIVMTVLALTRRWPTRRPPR